MHAMRRPKPYHHGHLREVLLQAAIQLIAEVGPAAFPLREVARRAGVSHDAPYRHFPDRGRSFGGGGRPNEEPRVGRTAARAHCTHHSTPARRLLESEWTLAPTVEELF